MKKIEELEKIEGNGKVILLNTDNGHWARMSKEWYNRSIQTVEEKEKFGQMLEERFGLLGEGVEKSHSIKSIYYSMTGKCNLNCEFCTMNSGPHVSTENDLTLSEIRNNLIPKLQKLNPRKVILTGGEPLVRKDVNEIIQSFSEVFGREKIILQSNGLLLTVEQLRKISGDIGILEISIENIFENPKLQEHMEQFFKCANELGIRLSLSFVVDSKSRKYLYDAIELCHKYEATVIRSNNIEKVDFHDVSFRYRKDVPVLDNVNIQLRKGTIVGFIGGSGCGKSSLVKMLLRLYAPYKGTISIDGEKIQDISINSLRNRIAFVAQDSLFFRGSILENLKMGNVVDNTKLIEYSKLLDLYDEIVCLPKKWDTELNAGTSNLSGGQKKRLDVLRALMKESDIIIFDESTASIDIERRKRLFEILDKIKQEKIIIFITHNIEECVYCDQIYAVKNRSVQQISYKNLSEAYS